MAERRRSRAPIVTCPEHAIRSFRCMEFCAGVDFEDVTLPALVATLAPMAEVARLLDRPFDQGERVRRRSGEAALFYIDGRGAPLTLDHCRQARALLDRITVRK